MFLGGLGMMPGGAVMASRQAAPGSRGNRPRPSSSYRNGLRGLRERGSAEGGLGEVYRSGDIKRASNPNLPAPAVQKLLAKTGLSIGDIDIIELNEAFASQGIAVLRQLGLADDSDHVNPHGGAIALGHPLGMSGARLALTAVNAMETLGTKRAIATMCIGVGQGIAALIERV